MHQEYPMWQPPEDDHLRCWGKIKSQDTVNMLQADAQLTDSPWSTMLVYVQVSEHLKTVTHLQEFVPVNWELSSSPSFYQIMWELKVINAILFFKTIGNMQF